MPSLHPDDPGELQAADMLVLLSRKHYHPREKLLLGNRVFNYAITMQQVFKYPLLKRGA